MNEALCAEMPDKADLWYSVLPHEIALAKRICKACPVRDACLQASLDYDEGHGIWGGLDAQRRRPMRRYVGIRPRAKIVRGVLIMSDPR